MEGIAKLLFLMLLGGFIAFVGDRIGKYFGKRKLTIFNLRPRYTSQIFTVIFGMLISLATFMVLAGISKHAREALFEVHELETRKQKLEEEIAQLNRLTTLNELIFHINQPIVMGAIQGGRSPKIIEQDLSALLSRANQVAIERSSEAGTLRGLPPIPSTERLVFYQKSDLERSVHALAREHKNFVVLVYALRNTYLREQVVVQFDLRENRRIYASGQPITSVEVDGSRSPDEILVDLFNLLSQLQQTALDAGMIPDPVTNNFGGNILVASLLDKRDQIKVIGGPARVSATANRDLYTAGPLDVRFDITPMKG